MTPPGPSQQLADESPRGGRCFIDPPQSADVEVHKLEDEMKAREAMMSMLKVVIKDRRGPDSPVNNRRSSDGDPPSASAESTPTYAATTGRSLAVKRTRSTSEKLLDHERSSHAEGDSKQLHGGRVYSADVGESDGEEDDDEGVILMPEFEGDEKVSFIPCQDSSGEQTLLKPMLSPTSYYAAQATNNAAQKDDEEASTLAASQDHNPAQQENVDEGTVGEPLVPSRQNEQDLRRTQPLEAEENEGQSPTKDLQHAQRLSPPASPSSSSSSSSPPSRRQPPNIRTAARPGGVEERKQDQNLSHEWVWDRDRRSHEQGYPPSAHTPLLARASSPRVVGCVYCVLF